ncbi:MAG TPA: NUDIX domain-containing protein [Oscillospiraceae bacterium]|nr:NUDIX domain-containing protein [Oscillospiraceae bacterium]HPF55860.1 NUDIX domain-containing protein [Clostridiales bacterium]HPK36432.1 NUDIX domain-containing protein [Oscillospiraceae bacterium]HPR76383.1 NUDIX domain-containing protein [Oscillospiraceae bacterium]
MAELWDIYDKGRNKTGKTLERGQLMRQDEYHLVVHVWVRNSRGEWLISKRTPNKPFAGMWECTGGSALSGEDSITAAVREAREELGIELNPDNGRLFRSVRRQFHNFPDFSDVWVFSCDCSIESVIFQEGETCDAKWSTSREINEMIERGEFIGRDLFPYIDDLFQKYDRKIPVDYDNGLLALIASVQRHYGVHTPYRTLQTLDSLLEKNYKNVVVMLFDGLGTAILKKHLPEDAFLRRHLKGTISSVFPPTTVSAITSFESGLAPIEHGWLGWSLYFKELDKNVSVFPNTISGSDGQPAADYNVARRYIPYESIYNKIKSATGGEVKASSVSPFSIYKSQSIDEICETVKTLCAEPQRNYIHTYWPQPDYDMHDLGTMHETVHNDIVQINEKVEKLCSDLTDTLIVITADHGLIDVEWRYLPEYPEIMDCLSRMPSIEPRALTFFVKPGREEDFETAFTAQFGNDYLLLSKEKVFAEKLFGDGEPHPRALGFLGDYLAVATGEISIDAAPRTDSHSFKAAHAGFTPDEMNVPLIVCETGASK